MIPATQIAAERVQNGGLRGRRAVFEAAITLCALQGYETTPVAQAFARHEPTPAGLRIAAFVQVDLVGTSTSAPAEAWQT